MTIGVDITPLQTGHRLRGIGAVIVSTINHLPEHAKTEHNFVFYHDEQSDISATEQLQLDDLSFELRAISADNPLAPGNQQQPSLINKIPLITRFLVVGKKLQSLLRAAFSTLLLIRGDSRINQLNDIDYFIQFDQNRALPRFSGRKLSVIYDYIPYVLESDYLWGYRTARTNECSILGALYKQLQRSQYLLRSKTIARQADKLIAISEHTKKDAVRLLGVSSTKITTVHLGVSPSDITDEETLESTREFRRYVDSSWGPAPRSVELGKKPYLLFIGGADPRRKLVDLVAAYNNLKAQGHDIQLVLAGDTMFGAKETPNDDLRGYLGNSSYVSDVMFLGFVDEEERNWLYNKALAFVYPSVYEGFGLPVIEAMSYGCPVICYKNSSVTEVGDEAALYAKGWQEIFAHSKKLLEDHGLREHVATKGVVQAKKLNWEDTSKNLVDTIVQEVDNGQ